MKIKGKVSREVPYQTVKGKKNDTTYYKYYVVISLLGSRTGELMVEKFCKSIDDFPALKVGDTVEMELDCKCTEWNGKLFNSISIAEVSIIGYSTMELGQPKTNIIEERGMDEIAGGTNQQFQQNNIIPNDFSDDLPF